jgi:hypothetical protein
VKTEHYFIINPILRRNSVLKVAREVSVDTMNQPKDDHICEDEDVDDEANDHELPTRLSKDKSPKKTKRKDDFISDKRNE